MLTFWLVGRNVNILCLGNEYQYLRVCYVTFYFYLCSGAGAGGADIIWGPGAGAENKFKYTFSAVSLKDARKKKSLFLPLIIVLLF